MKFIMRLKNGLANTNLLSMLIKGTIVSLFILVSFWIPVFATVAVVVCAVFVVYENSEKSLYYILFLVPFHHLFRSGYFPLWLAEWRVLFCFIILFNIVRQVVMVFKKQEKINWWLLSAVLAFLIYTIIPFGKIKIMSTFNKTIVLLAFYCFVIFRKKLNLKDATIILSVGIIVSCCMGFVVDYVPRVAYYIAQYSAVNVYRYSALFNNPNNLPSYIMAAICSLMILFIKKKIGWEFFPLFLVLSVFAYLTVSRLFIIIYGLVLLTFIVIYLIKNPFKKSIIIISCILLSLVASFGLLYKYTEAYMVRLKVIPITEIDGQYEELPVRESQTTDAREENPIDDPGRPGLWARAIKDWSSSPRNIIFGVGLGGERLGNFTEHNTYITLLRTCGIVGFLLFVNILVAAYCEIFKKRFRRVPWLSLIAIVPFVVIAFIEPLFHKLTLGVFLIMMFMCMYDELISKENNLNTNEVKIINNGEDTKTKQTKGLKAIKERTVK